MDAKEVFSLFIEILALLVSILWHIVVSGYRKIVPIRKKDVRGEIVLITGAGSGLGRLMSYRFAELGATVVCSDISKESNEETVENILSSGGKAYGIVFDCSNRQDVYAAAEKIKADVGNVTILVNNAGFTTGTMFIDCPDTLIEKTLHVNTFAAFWTTKAFFPHMKERNHGHIVNIASVAGFGGVAKLSVYCASKFAVVGFTESLLLEIRKDGLDGIYCTCVAPYFINTGMFEGVKIRFPRIFPVLDAKDTVDIIMAGVLRNQHVIMIPKLNNLLLFLIGLFLLKVLLQ